MYDPFLNRRSLLNLTYKKYANQVERWVNFYLDNIKSVKLGKYKFEYSKYIIMFYFEY